MKHCSGWFFGRFGCPLPGNWRAISYGGSAPYCRFHVRRYRKARFFQVTRNDW